jgi:hypothetical protein
MSMGDYLESTSNRDKVMGVVQFLPMLLDGPLNAAGAVALNNSMASLSQMSNVYRAMTRFGILFHVLTRGKLRALQSIESSAWRKVATLDTLCDALFCPFEHLSVFAFHGVIAGGAERQMRLGGMAVFFWAWGLILKLIMRGYDIQVALQRKGSQPAGAAQDSTTAAHSAKLRQLVTTFVRLLSFLLLAMSFLPKGKPQLLANGPAGVLGPLHKFVAAVSPPNLPISRTTQGLLGCIGTLI